MSLLQKHTDFEPKTADEYRQVAGAHAQTLKDFWKRFAVSGLFIIAVVIIIFASLAWFASNNRVNAITSSISANAGRFSVVGATDEGSQVGYYERSGSTQRPTTFTTTDAMNVSATFNLNNYNSGSLRPGASGQLQITVTPNAKDVHDIEISLERLVEARSGATASNGLADLFRGHIVFFLGKNENGYYSDPILDDALTIRSSEFCEEGSSETTKKVTRTLYWVWPSQFSSFVLTGSINYNKNLFKNTSADGYSKLLSAINASKSGTAGTAQYYRDTDGDTSGIASLPDVASGMSSANLQTCSDAYDHADEVLGTNAAYLQLRLTAEEVTQ